MSFNVSYLYEIIDKASGPLKKIAAQQKYVRDQAVKHANAAEKAAHKNGKALDSLSSKFGEIAGVAATAFAVAFPIREAMRFESAMSDVAKVVDFKDPKGLKNMGNTIKRLSTEIPITQNGLAAIVAAGGQFGVPAEKLAGFAEQAAKMAIAFDIMPQEAGLAMAKLSGAFGIPIEQMTRIGDTINYVSNNVAASASEIVRSLKTGAAAGGRALGLTEEQTIALSTAFIAQGVSASEAGTRIQTLARNMMNGAKTSKIFGKGFADIIKKNPQAALEKVFDAMRRGAIPQEKLNELFGETVNDFTLLAKNGDKYAEILKLVSDKTAIAGSMQREFEARASTTEMQMQLLSNSVRNIALNFGSALLPALKGVVSFLKPVSVAISELTESVPWLSQLIGGAVIGLLAFKTVAIGAKLAMLALNFAMIANPIGLWMAAISAVIGVALAFSDEIAGLIKSMVKFIGLAEFFGIEQNELKPGEAQNPNMPPASKLPDIVAPGAAEVKGKIDVSVSVKDGKALVESVKANRTGGNLGMNMAVAQ